jgi:hypothetical protein
MNGARPVMHFMDQPRRTAIPGPPLATRPARFLHSGRLFGTHCRLGYDSTLQRGWEGEKAFGAVHPYTDERGWDNFAGSMCGKTQAFDSV